MEDLSGVLKDKLQQLVRYARKLEKDNRRLRNHIDRYAMLCDLTNLLTESYEQHRFFEAILEMALKMTESKVGGIFIVNPMNQKLLLKVSTGSVEPTLIKWMEDIPQALEKLIIQGKVVELVRDEPFLQQIKRRDPGVGSMFFFPLQISQEATGLGFVIHRQHSLIHHASSYGNDLHFLQLLAKQASVIAQLNTLKFEQQSQQMYFKTITALTEAIDAKDMYTAGHSQRVAEISTTIAYALGLTQREIDTIHYGALLHDIGKIGIPETILNKKGRLTDEEFFNVKRHPLIGTNILKTIDFLDDALSIVRSHHERYDGKGYPDRLAGEDIPFMARVVGVADAWDAMTSNRSYRKALPIQTALEELELNSATQFDPTIIDTLQKKSFMYLKEM